MLQAIWLYIGELAGKDLDLFIIAKFLFYFSPRMITMFLPLCVLLTSIKTFGEFSENYEFAAMKSAGVSLIRAMVPLIVFISLLALLSFWFANNVAPKSEYKFINMRRDIAQIEPSMAIVAGRFNDLGDMNLKVKEKKGDKNEILEDVLIHVKPSNNSDLGKVIKSKSGRIETDENTNFLKLHLFNGNFYEEIEPSTYEQRQKIPFTKTHFKKYTLTIDLNELNQTDQNKEDITNLSSMLTAGQLIYTIDSLSTELYKEAHVQKENILIRTNQVFDKLESYPIKKLDLKSNNLLKGYSIDEQLQILRNAYSNAESTAFTVANNELLNQESLKEINRREHTLNEKFVVAFSCLLMFFIGAPLGAIIRKGGLGLPMVLAVLIFIIFHFTNTFGKKIAQENGISGWAGAWMSVFLLLPLAINFTFKASKDRGINGIDVTIYSIKEFIIKRFSKNKNQKNV